MLTSIHPNTVRPISEGTPTPVPAYGSNSSRIQGRGATHHRPFSGPGGVPHLEGMRVVDIFDGGGSAMKGATAGAGAAAGAASIIPSVAAAGSIVPIIGTAIGAAVGAVTYLISRFKRTGKQKVMSTQIVNKVEPYLQQNLDAYLSSNRTQSENAQAQQNFYDLWNIVVEKCSDPRLGDAGRRCTEDRQEGATPPWGGRNWFERYLDPVRNDPNVTTDPIGSGSGTQVIVDPVTGERRIIQGSRGGGVLFGLDPKVLMLGAAGLAAVLLVGGGDKS